MLKATIKCALNCGYRHFDCAWLYANEAVIGNALKEAINESNGALKREDIFLTSKVWNTHHSKHLVRECLNETLANLQVDYIDLYLVHWPMGFKVNAQINFCVNSTKFFNCFKRKMLVWELFQKMPKAKCFFQMYITLKLTR